MYTSFRDFSNDNVSRSLSHTLPLPFRTQQILKPVRFLFPFSFFQYGPPVTPVTLSMQEKKTKEGRIKRRRERKTKKKERYNAITQIRKSIAYSSRHKCARDCSRLLGSQYTFPFIPFRLFRLQVERMECGCVYDTLSGSGTRSMGKTFRSYKIHRIYKLCRTADRGAGFETRRHKEGNENLLQRLV